MKFNIGQNFFCAEGGKAIAEALKNNQIMTELDISSNDYLSVDANDESDMSGVIAISNTIPTMGSLTSLNISKCNLTNYGTGMSGVQALAAAIPRCKRASFLFPLSDP